MVRRRVGNGSDSGGVAGARQMPGANRPNGAAPDPLDAAIAAAQPFVVQPTHDQVLVTLGNGEKVPMWQFGFPLPTSGRLAIVTVPVDLNEREALGLHSLVNQIYDSIYAERVRRAGPQIILAPGVRIPPPPS